MAKSTITADGSTGETDGDAASAREFVAKLCLRPAAPSRTRQRRGLVLPGPRPAQQFWGMNEP
jgi:hypothetical protein